MTYNIKLYYISRDEKMIKINKVYFCSENVHKLY